MTPLAWSNISINFKYILKPIKITRICSTIYHNEIYLKRGFDNDHLIAFITQSPQDT